MLVFSYLLLALFVAQIAAQQDGAYKTNVSLESWSNYDEITGGCLACPYTCVKPDKTGIDANTTLPEIFSQPTMNGCCYAKKATVQPDCSKKATPAEAEDCGFLYGPSLTWDISDKKAPEDGFNAMLFASIDCMNFWAVGKTPIMSSGPVTDSTGVIKGSKQINGGCYGDPSGSAIVLSSCLSNDLKFDKSGSYTYKDLKTKCKGLSGQCARTNGQWGANLKCCDADGRWDLEYSKYMNKLDTGVELSGLAITGIVFGGVAVLLLLVHCGKKTHERAKATRMMREQEALDDYEEISTPLNEETAAQAAAARARNPVTRGMPSSMEVSLHEGDKIYSKKNDELLYEGELR